MNITELENAIRAWVLSTTGLDPSRVWFSDQPVPSPAISSSSPRITIGVSNSRKVGQDELRHTFDSSRPAGQEIEYQAIGPREVTVSLQAFAADGSSFELLETARTGLRLPSVRDALNAAGVGVLREGDVRSLFAVRGTTYEDRALLELVVLVSSSAVERLGYIDRVEITYGEGPVLQMVGATDVARLVKLERWARIDQPSFPRLVQGPRGKDAVQFSRFGADVVSNTVRNPGHLRDLAADADFIGALLKKAHTVSWWMRPDPLSSQPVGTSTSQRVFGLTGFGTTPTAQGCFYGVSYSPATSSLLLVTQVPGNLSGTSISVLSSSFVYPALPIGVWSHVAVVLAPNGLDVPPLNIGATATWYLNGALAFTQIGDGSLVGGPRMPQWSLFPPPRAIASVGATWSNSLGVFANGYDGAIDELVIYPRALNATEVAALHASGPFGLRP